ncbi:MAG TPA: VIT and VWA domain-containing protein [Candidatus Acidoferrum sp.]|nr:VIT and VWA domain-containing protein [Candidatus Acidoferrum sp.]
MTTSRIAPELIARSFGLVGTVENTRVVLPLKAVECDFSATAGLVEVTMTQVFRQENPKPLDCDYLFPLPADASVYSCEADFNGHIIRAKVKERGEAVRLAEEKKAEGRRVALVESERENLFTLSLMNIQPDDLVLITLKYIQPLRFLAGMPSVEIPLCPGIRYIPGNPLIRSNRGKGIADDTDQVPDASRISPVRLEKEHPDAAFVEIRGRLDSKFVDATAIQSPSHNVISRPQGDVVEIRLSDKGEVPDRDFVLRWEENKPEKLTSRAWLQEVGAETYALMEIRAPKASGPPVPIDFYFLMDDSGSMQGVKWQKAALAVQTCVSKLTEHDRVMVSIFSNGVRDFAERPLPPAALLADDNFRRLEKSFVGGGTELGGALVHVLKLAADHTRERQKTLILITDAQVGNEAAILKIMESAPDFPMHCFGIDMALNDALLLALARQQQGTFHSLNPQDDVVKVISDLAASIRHPVLHELRLSDGWEPSVKYLPPLFSEQVFHLSARSNQRQPLSLCARNGDTQAREISITCQPANSEAPGLHWCKNRIQHLLLVGDTPGAIALSVQSNLICPLTAFIAWDELEKVAVANHSLAQPVIPIHQQLNMASCLVSRFFDSLGCTATAHEMNPNIAASRAFRRVEGQSLPTAGLSDPFDPYADIRRTMDQHICGLVAPQPAHLDGKGERMDSLQWFFSYISKDNLLQHLACQFELIMKWAFAGESNWLQRSDQVSRLLLDLHRLAAARKHAPGGLYQKLVEMERQHHRPNQPAIQVWQKVVNRLWTEAELVESLESQFQERLDSLLIADYVRFQNEIKGALEGFIKQHLKP